MEKYYFDEPQPRITVGNGTVLVLMNGREVEKTVGDGMETSHNNAKFTEWEYDGERLQTGGMTSEAALTAAAQKLMQERISTYDSSPSVNGFLLNGLRVWLNKDTRVGLMNSTQIAKGMGQTTTTLWFGGMKMEVDCDKAITLLSALEMYALECFNTTAKHKAAVEKMQTVEEVLGYDYTQGYPEQLKMEVSL